MQPRAEQSRMDEMVDGRDASAHLDSTMKISGESDVLIVGAGPTGTASGILLRRAGFDVCVVDAARFPRDKVCGDAVSNQGVRLIEALGAGDAMRSVPHARVARAAAVFPDGARIERSYREPGYIVPRVNLDDCLRRCLEASGARLIEDCRVSELTRHHGRVVGASGAKLNWRATLVIAADGYGSVAQRALDVARPRGKQLAVAATAYYRNVSFPHGADTADHFFEHELPYGYAWIFPAVGGVANVGVYIRADAYAETGGRLNALLDGFVARHPERFARAERVGALRSWPLPLAPRNTPVSAAGLLLAGDAAGFVDPLSGEGIWQALHSGATAAEVAADALRNGGQLTTHLQHRYFANCAHAIARPSRRKAWVQQWMQQIMKRRVYANPLLRHTLRWGYQHQWLETSKA